MWSATRTLPQSLIEEIQHRYSLIGTSPLTEITMEQARLAGEELAAGGDAVSRVRGYAQLASVYSRRCGSRCAPMGSKKLQSSAWRRRIRGPVSACIAGPSKLKLRECESTLRRRHGPIIRCSPTRSLSMFARGTQHTDKGDVGSPVPVLFTAHSVPKRTVEAPSASSIEPRLWPGSGADPYADEARHTAELVAARVREIPRWWFAFQSQGASRGEWIGPSVESTLDSIASEGVKALILQPIGFLCDHVEILFDVDRMFRDYAAGVGVRLERPESLNDSPTLARAVADLAGKGLARLRNS